MINNIMHMLVLSLKNHNTTKLFPVQKSDNKLQSKDTDTKILFLAITYTKYASKLTNSRTS